MKDLSLNFVSQSPIAISGLLVSIVVGLLLSLAIRWHFKRYGSTLSNREEFSQVFPFILLTTILIITVVKSSLALSLGLVGALSIVRFRTPIKEPEELAYLFLSIAAGLGLGAGQLHATVLAVVFILGVMAVLRWNWNERDLAGKNFFLSIDFAGNEEKLPKEPLEDLNRILLKNTRSADLRRYDRRSESIEAVYSIDLVDSDSLEVLVREVREVFPDIGISFLDHNQLFSA